MKEGHRDERIHQKQSGLQRFFLKKGWFRSLLCALLGLLLVISFHTGTAVATSKPSDWKAEQIGRSLDATSQSFQPSATAPIAQLVQQAEDLHRVA